MPAGSLPADIWLLDPPVMARLCTRVFNQCSALNSRLPAEATDCELSLLPKPGRVGQATTRLEAVRVTGPLL